MDTLNQMPYPSKKPEGNSVGAVIAIVIIIILLLLGGVYFFQTSDFRNNQESVDNSTTSTSTQDDLNRIEADLNALEKEDRDEASQIDAEFTGTTTIR